MCSGGQHGLPDLVICLTAKSLTSVDISKYAFEHWRSLTHSSMWM